MLSKNLEQSLHRALGVANEKHHEYATLEHLLFALTDDQDALAVLKACGVDVDKLREDLLGYIDTELNGRSLGTYMVLRLIERCRDLGLPYLYLGYWIAGGRKMSYKTRFRPLEALGPDGWAPITEDAEPREG